MSGGDAAYAFSLTTFSRSGKLLQIEYALNAVQSGKMSLGIKATNGVVLCTEKKLPTVLIDDSDVKKVEMITPSTGFVFSGLGPDYRVLVRKARKRAQAYYRVYREHQPVAQLVKETASVMQEYTQSGGVRPFGVSLLVAGYDDDGPQLYQVDPSGAYFGWKASAIGKNYVNAKNFLERRYDEEMALDDAVHTALLTMRESFEGEMNENNIEIGVIGPDRQFRVLSPQEVKDYLDEAT
mmetsp:Transcript_18341/g.24205  ORF Transcript_18341/g.24205 Transcript_18341/m.24205 type:complete len:238 (-) Transcript_18341:317-1030(-)|eukprot:CAMPEP_0117754974 /NCGR_PEP_ID=MMETSP0947-20121206/13168_1 /TAXON_ID=44440 /ORGANISM="Chattonella subsalsa, Strain CCMP2191" /LENGTH=237 /DNA_ID=CAMNT_0005574205 /DNA_START=93 /DNA_END=806 /DNA_ORIENTATION=+